jgi:hypothetical protein
MYPMLGEVPERLSQAWRASVARTGRWDAPAYWQSDSYREDSPWSPEEVESAAEAVRKVYPPEVAASLLRDSSSFLWGIVADPGAPWVSNFLSFGFDARDAEAWRLPSLLRRLRNEEEYEGARFELALLSAFRRARIPCKYEPLSGTQGPNPDFSLDLGAELVVEAKLARESHRTIEEREWFERITLVRDLLRGVHAPHPVRFRIELTDHFRAIQESEVGRRWIRSNLERLEMETRRLRDRLALSLSLPDEGDVEGLVRVLALHPQDPTGGHHLGVPPDSSREAARIVRGCLTSGARQVPEAMKGLVFIRVDWHTSLVDVAREATRWFSEEGEAYPALVGAVFVAHGMLEGETVMVDELTAVWRGTVPGPWREPSVWDQVAAAFNWRESRIISWQRERARQSNRR